MNRMGRTSRTAAGTAGAAAGRKKASGGAPGRGRAARLAIVGAGRAGSALAAALAHAGWTIAAIAARRPAPAQSLARRCGAPLATIDAAAAARGADAVILAVPDRMLPHLVRALARASAAGPAPGRRKGGTVRTARRNEEVLRRSPFTPRARAAPRPWLPCAREAGRSLLPPASLLPEDRTGPIRARRHSTSVSLFDGAGGSPSTAIPPRAHLAGRIAASLGAQPLPAASVPPSARGTTWPLLRREFVVTLVWEATRLLEEAGVPRGRTLAALLPLTARRSRTSSAMGCRTP